MKEHLVRFHLKNGETIDMHRDGTDVIIGSQYHQVTIPHATGQQALDMIATLEPLGERVEYPEEETEGEER